MPLTYFDPKGMTTEAIVDEVIRLNRDAIDGLEKRVLHVRLVDGANLRFDVFPTAGAFKLVGWNGAFVKKLHEMEDAGQDRHDSGFVPFVVSDSATSRGQFGLARVPGAAGGAGAASS